LKRLLTPDGLLFVGPAEAALLLNHEMASIKRPLAFGFRKCASAPRNIPSVAKQVVRKQKPSLTALPPKAPSPKFHAKSQRVSLSHPPANSPGRTAADLSRVRELADKGQLAEAAKLCQRWIEDNPPSAEAFHLLGVIHDAAGDSASAEIQYRKALYLKPNDHDCLIHLAYLLEHLGDPAGALQFRERANRIKERSAAHG